jgi:hypothetical protein
LFRIYSDATIYSAANPSYAIDGSYDEFVAFNGYHPSRSEEVIVLNKNLSTSVYTEFYNGYYEGYFAPVVTGDSAGRANLLWYNSQSKIYQTTYNGTSWSTPSTTGTTGYNYPTVTVNNPAGGTAFAFWMQGTSAPYSITTGLGALSKQSSEWIFARKVTLADTATGNSVDVQLQAPTISDALGNVTSPTFSSVNDGGTYDAASVWTALTTVPLAWSGSGTLTANRMLSVSKVSKGVDTATIPLTFAVLDAQTGQVLGSETVPMSEYDTTLAGEDVVSIPFTAASGHSVMLSVTCTASNSVGRYVTTLGNIYGQVNASTQKKSLVGDRFASAKPRSFSLSNAYPNPFNPSTRINYQLASQGHVVMKVFNILGQQVTKLVDRDMQAGSFTETWNANNAPSGVSFIRVSVNNQFGKSLFQDVKKVMLVK